MRPEEGSAPLAPLRWDIEVVTPRGELVARLTATVVTEYADASKWAVAYGGEVRRLQYAGLGNIHPGWLEVSGIEPTPAGPKEAVWRMRPAG